MIKNVKQKWWPASRMAWGAEEDKRSPHSGCGGTACSVWDPPTAYLLPLPLSSREEFWDHTRGSVEQWLSLMLETNRQIQGDLSNTCDHDQRNSKSCQVFNLSYCTNSFWLKAQKKIFNEAINWIYFPGHAAPRKDFEMEGFPNNSCLSFLLLRYKWDDLLCSSTNKCFQNQKRTFCSY